MPTRVNNQAVKLYDSTETLFNDRTSECQWHQDFYPLVTCDDTSDIIINIPDFVPNVETDGNFDYIVDGTTTSLVVNALKDTGADFVTDAVEVGMTVHAKVGASWVSRAKVTAITSPTELAIDSSIYNFPPEPYEISWWEYEGEVTLANNSFEVNNISATGSWLQQTCLQIGSNYKVTFSITSVSADIIGDQIRVLIGGNTVLTLDETDIVAKTYTAYGKADTEVFRLETDGGMVVTIDDIDITQVYDTSFEVKDCETDSIQYTSVDADITYSNSQSQLKMGVDWSNLMDGYTCQGCYYIDVTQGIGGEDSEKITNGDFATDSDWTKGTGWTISGGSANLNFGSGSVTALSQTIALRKGLSYELTFDISSYTSGTIDVILYNGVTEVIDLGSWNSGGIKTVSTGILTSDVDLIGFETGIDGFARVYSIDDVSMILDSVLPEYNYRTDCFQLSDSHDCTVKLSGTNNDNAFGIDFIGLSYTPIIRVSGELMTAKYDGDKENEEDSNGQSQTLYFKSNEIRELFLHQLPEFHHTFIRLLLGYDVLNIDDIEYISTGSSYEPESDRVLGKITDLSNSTTELRLKDDLNENKFC